MSYTSHPNRSSLHLVVLAIVCTLSGCAIGPIYQRPTLSASQGYEAPEQKTAAPASSQLQAQRFEIGQQIAADWWRVFGSDKLDRIIKQSFDANPTIQAAQSGLRAAQEAVLAQRAAAYPTVGVSYTPSRTKVATNAPGSSPGDDPGSAGSIYSFHTSQVSASFKPDVFGQNRRAIEGQIAQEQQQRFALEAAYITLATNLVSAAIQEAQLREQIRLTQEQIKGASDSVNILERQHKAGYASKLDLSLQVNALAQTEQLLPTLQKQLALNRNLMRALLGLAQDAPLEVTFTLQELKLPTSLPLSLPAQLIEQRPDVRAAEESLKYASAQVGIAIANRLPRFSIDANLGSGASSVGKMFSPGGHYYSLIGSLMAPVFDAGALKHQQIAAEHSLQQADAQYRATVLASYQNVADAMQSIEQDAAAFNVATKVERSARESLDLMKRQHVGGYVDRITLINAEQAYRQATLNLVQANATTLNDSALLYQVLGGGWWNRDTKNSQ